MQERAMLGLEATGFAIVLLFGGVRLYVGYLKRWQPYRIEVFGVITFELAVAFALYVCAHWSSDGVRMVRWRAEGADDNTIRMKLLTSKDFKFIYASNVVAVSSLWAAKASFLASYATTYPQLGKRMKMLYVVAAVYAFLSYLGTMAAYLFACLPVHLNWDIMSPDFCATVLQAAPLHAGLALNITSDILLLSIPLLILLGMRRRRKFEIYGVSLVLFLGMVSIVMTVYRAADTEISGFTKGKPLTLPKRNAYIVQEMVMITSMLAAFVLPSLRVLLRSKRDQQEARKVGSGGSGSGKSGESDPEFGKVKMFGMEYSESTTRIHGPLG